MKSYERAQLLERVDRDGATVGLSIPDEIEVDGEPFPLREFVFDVKRVDAVDDDELQAAKRTLRRARLDRQNRLEEADISRADGEALVEEILGLNRALNALQSLGGPSIEAEMQRSELADEKRWQSFLDDVLARGGRR